MPSAEVSLTPHDNLALLSAIAQGDAVARTETRKREDAKRDIVAALKSSALLVAADDGAPRLAPAGPDGGYVLAAFTDTEAAEAWLAARHPEAPRSGFARSSELAGGDPDWLSLCGRHGISALAVNPAGPLGAMVYSAELERLRPRLLHRPPAPDPQLAWLDLAERAAERARAAELMARLAAAVSARDAATADTVANGSGPINRLRSLLVGAELHRLGGRLRLADGESESGLQELAGAGAQFRLAGEPEQAIDTLLETAEGLLKLTAEDDPGRREWASLGLAQVRESLTQLAVTGYRRADIERMDSHGAGPA